MNEVLNVQVKLLVENWIATQVSDDVRPTLLLADLTSYSVFVFV